MEETRRRRSRSLSDDPEDERRHRRRRRDGDKPGALRRRNSFDSERNSRRSGRSDRFDTEDRNRRRSRSPVVDSFRSKNYEADSKHRIRDDHSQRRERSKERNPGTRKDDPDTQSIIRKRGPLPSQVDSFSLTKDTDPNTALVLADDKPLQEKQKPNFAPTGMLAVASNTVAHVDGTTIVLKYHEPPEARKPPPKDKWKLFVFKGSDIIETIDLSLRSCWLVGRELAVVDLAAEHPSISKQHAAIQFRWIEKKNEFGDKLGRVKPYLIDLESANGTMLNKESIPSSRYLELRDKDMIQFGDSTREYVLMLPPKE